MKSYTALGLFLAVSALLSGCGTSDNASNMDTTPERLVINGYGADVTAETIADLYYEFAVRGTIAEIGPETYFTLANLATGVNDSAVYFTPVRISITEGSAEAPTGDIWIAVHSDLSPSFDVDSIGLGDNVVVASEHQAYDRGTGQPMHVIQYFGEVSADGLTIAGLHETDAKDLNLRDVLDVFGLS